MNRGLVVEDEIKSAYYFRRGRGEGGFVIELSPDGPTERDLTPSSL